MLARGVRASRWLPFQHRANMGLSIASMLLSCAKMSLWCLQQLQRCQAVCSCVSVKQLIQHATAIPSRTYPFSSDQGSQTGLGSTSTRLSDRPGTLSAVVSQPFLLLGLGWKAVLCCLITALLHAQLWLCSCVLHVVLHVELDRWSCSPSSVVPCSGVC